MLCIPSVNYREIALLMHNFTLNAAVVADVKQQRSSALDDPNHRPIEKHFDWHPNPIPEIGSPNIM